MILVGEMRDEETVHTALSAAETGHLVLSTLHTVDAPETINRIIDFFPPHQQQQARAMIAGTLKGIISQRLVATADGKGRVATCEIMVMTGRVHDMILDPKQTGMLGEVVAEGGYYGMQTFDQHLLEHLNAGRITMEDATRAASSPHDFKLMVAAQARIGPALAPEPGRRPDPGQPRDPGPSRRRPSTLPPAPAAEQPPAAPRSRPAGGASGAPPAAPPSELAAARSAPGAAPPGVGSPPSPAPPPASPPESRLTHRARSEGSGASLPPTKGSAPVQTTLAQFNETQSTEAFALQNSRLLKVSLNQVTIQAKLGSMVAYQGDVSFEHAGSGGLGRMLKKAVSGEGTSLMRMTGSGEVFLADQAQDIHLIYLENDTITVNGPNLLAFDAGIDWDIHRLSGGAAGAMARRPLQHGADRHRLGGDPLRRPARAAQRGPGADVRRRAGRDHVVVGRHGRDQDRLQDEEPDRPRLGRVDPDGLQRSGLGARPAVRGSHRAGRRRVERRRARQHPSLNG